MPCLNFYLSIQDTVCTDLLCTCTVIKNLLRSLMDYLFTFSDIPAINLSYNGPIDKFL